MSTISRESLGLICKDLWFSKNEFERMLNELVKKEFLSAHVISKQESYTLTDKAFNLLGVAKK